MLGHPVARGEEKSCAKIHNLDSRPLLLRAHDVLRLEVHVDYVLVVQVLHLVSKHLQACIVIWNIGYIFFISMVYLVYLPLDRSVEQRGRSVTP